MTITTITKTKGGEITLPKEIRKSWKGADIFIRASNDTIILKKVYQPTRLFDPATIKKLKSAGRKISDKDISRAVKAVRSGKK